MRIETQDKVNRAIRFLQSVAATKSEIELAYSGGKDSDVILELAKMAEIPFTPIYRNTTIDPPGTIEHVKEMGVQIRQPEHTFFELIEKKGFPTRRCRFCCSELKEYKILDTCILGIRREESSARRERYKEPTMCRLYGKKECVEQILPILDWTLCDVSEFIKDRGIRLAPVYYSNGNPLPDFSKRLGCIGCPLASDNGVSDFKQYPKMLKKWIEHGMIEWKQYPNRSKHKKFGNIYALVAHDLFFDNYSDFQAANTSLFGEVDWKGYLEQYFKIEL